MPSSNNGPGSAPSATQAHNAQGAATPHPTPEFSHQHESTSTTPSNIATFDDKFQDSHSHPNAEETLKSLEDELDTPQFHLLDEEWVYSRLRWAGFKGNYKTLSTLSLSRRPILRVDDPALHLMWTSSPPTHFIKPLPSALARTSIVEEILRSRDEENTKARGLLYSYTRLIHSELDYRIALENNLLPWSFSNDEKGWEKWCELTKLFRGGSSYRNYNRKNHHIDPDDRIQRLQNKLRSYRGKKPIMNSLCEDFARGRKEKEEELEQREQDTVEICHRRYKYGDLRLERVNMITWLNGYGYNFRAPSWSRLEALFERHKTFVAAYVIYTGLVLTAMQVSLQASDEPEWVTQAFRYIGYVVIIATGGQPLLLFCVFVLWVVWQLVSFRTLTHEPPNEQPDQREVSNGCFQLREIVVGGRGGANR